MLPTLSKRLSGALIRKTTPTPRLSPLTAASRSRTQLFHAAAKQKAAVAEATSTPSVSSTFNPLSAPPIHRPQHYTGTMPSKSPYARDYGDFKLLQSLDLTYAPVTMSKWRSEKTGLTVTLGNHSSPLTRGYFIIASEIFDDTGRPHTLEHLVFMGSKSYPYKGVLDHLANRAGSNGTNAWTANDHTAYTITTAGTKGFLNMLPVYVDHILHPTMTDASFVTEIHHINGEGEDAGVVYSEMQGRENTSYDQMALKHQRALYPETSAYRSETGGLLKMLRVLTAQQIRDYHAKYYQPYNLNLHIDGAVDVDELFEVLSSKVEPMILEQKKGQQEIIPSDWKRPFVETPSAQPVKLTESKIQVAEFMETDESMGEVMSVWLGPSQKDQLTQTALSILASYLTHSATAPLRKEFIEIPEPYASSISFWPDLKVNGAELCLYAGDVPKKHLTEMPILIRAKLQRIVKKEGIDMTRMAMILSRERRSLLNEMETGTSNVLMEATVEDFLYGDKDGKDLPNSLEELTRFDTLSKWTAEQWAELLNKYYASAPSITTIGKPSAKMAKDIEETEKARVAEQREKLGDAGLKNAQAELDAAKEESDRPIPPEVLTSFPIVDPKDITWVPVDTALNPAPGDKIKADNAKVQAYVDADGAPLPYQVYFSSVASNFVTINVLFDAATLPSHLMPYVNVFQGTLFQSDVKRADGTELSHEEVVNAINEITVEQYSSFSFRRVFQENLCVSMKVEAARYAEAVAWLRDVLAGAIFTKDRLEVIVAKRLQALPGQKRDGQYVAASYANKLAFDPAKSPSESKGLLTQLEFLPRLAEELKTDPDAVIKAMNELRTALLDPSAMRVSVFGNITELPQPRSVLRDNFLPIKDARELRPLSTSAQTLTPLGQNPARKMSLISMAAIEGSYSSHYARGPQGWDHPDLAALILASSVLNTMESYLWKSIRGSGLAYGADVQVDVEAGQVEFSVYRSPNACIAFREAGKVLRSLASGETELDSNIVDGSRASLIYSYAGKSETVASAASTAYVDQALKGVGKDFSQRMLAKLPSITDDEVRRVIKQYFVPLFDPATSIGAVSTNAGKAEEVEQGFKELGYEVSREVLPELGNEDEMSGSESGSETGSESGDEPMDDVRSP